MKIKDTGAKEDKFPEHSFVASCLKSGFSYRDLKSITYIDALKVLLSNININEDGLNGYRKATQADMDKLAR